MAWEKRRGNLYYYRVARVNGRIVRRYLGRGPEAVAAANQDAARRAERAALRQAEQAQWQSDLAVSERVSAFSAEADALVEAALLAVVFTALTGSHGANEVKRNRDGEQAREGWSEEVEGRKPASEG